jgi:hypothetical protein
MTNNFVIFELELDTYRDHEHRSNYMCCSETNGVDVDRAADPLPVEVRFSPVTKNAAKLFSLRFAFNVIRLYLKQLCLNILGSF